VTQPDSLDFAVTVDRLADADHRVCKIDEPGLRTGLLHIMSDPHHRADVTGCVGETARAAILGVWLPDAVFEWYLKVLSPQSFACPNFDGQDDETRAFERFLMVGMGGDDEARIPLSVKPFGQTLNSIKRFRIVVHECQCAAVQFFATHQGRKGVFPEGGAACTDNNDFGWESHSYHHIG